ncbi:unnamed protein product [Mytilus edulis]|uniref:B box-type domain-containing protein n=1 Tax=Mytilus edulis TaxID=6550 RepID=A0A8S3RFZ6_MYTED|nr:unnamed protein product [Mytilus edulis]
MASSSQSCGVCDLRHINKPSIIWCTECDEGLCQECQEHHSLSKGTRNHNTIAITEYQTLPSDVLKITQYCSSHEDKFIMYCRKHERPCCRKCIVETHKECPDIDNLEDVIQNVKTSNAFYDIEETLVEVAENLKKISQHQQKNLLNLKEKRKQIQKKFKRPISCPISKVLEKVQIETKPCDIVLSRKKIKQAQIIVPTVPSRCIENIKLKKNKTIATEGKYILGCCLIPDGRMAFTYYIDCAVRVFSDTGLKDFEVKMPCNVYDILYISKDDTLAVTSGGSRSKCITIINVKENK